MRTRSDPVTITTYTSQQAAPNALSTSLTTDRHDSADAQAVRETDEIEEHSKCGEASGFKGPH